MKLESTAGPNRELGAAAAFRPLLWLVIAAALAVTTLMFAPVPPL
jgi:hypothetical protein